jgi:hypothetical protein
MEAYVDHLEHRDLRVVILAEKAVDKGPSRRFFLRGEETDRSDRAETVQHDSSGDRVPGVRLSEDVEARETLFGRAGGGAH